MDEVTYQIEPKEDLECDKINKIVKETLNKMKEEYPQKADELEKVEINHKNKHKMALSVDGYTLHFLLIVGPPIVQELFRELVLPKLKKKFKNISQKEEKDVKEE